MLKPSCITALHIFHDNHRNEAAMGRYGLTGRIEPSHAGSILYLRDTLTIFFLSGLC